MNSEAPLYKRDPEAWTAHLAEGNVKQARKRVGADVIIRDQQERILLVNPGYKPDWDLPGGMVEDNEPPHQAARREVQEELGVDLDIGPALCVDWVSPHGPWDDSLMFIFDGGTVDQQGVARLHIVDGELRDFRFCDRQEASALLRPYFWQRVSTALDAASTGRCMYLVDGEPQRR